MPYDQVDDRRVNSKERRLADEGIEMSKRETTLTITRTCREALHNAARKTAKQGKFLAVGCNLTKGKKEKKRKDGDEM